MLSLLLLSYFLRTVESKANLTAVFYDIDLRDDLEFDLKSLVKDYARTFNYSISLLKFDDL